MPTPRASAGRLAGVGVGVLCGVGGGLLGLVLGADDVTRFDAASQNVVDAVVGITCTVIAAVLLLLGRLARGAQLLAVVLLVAGASAGLTAATTGWAVAATTVTDAVRVAVQLQSFLWVPGFLPLLTLVPLLYPDGLLPGRLWRGVAWTSVLGTVLMTAGVGLYPETFHARVDVARPVSAAPLAGVLFPLSVALLLPSVGFALASLGIRLRRSAGLARRQVVVLLGAAGVLVVVTALQGALPTPADVLLQAAAVALVPLAIGVAVTRHRLYDLDTAVCRALALASLAVCLAGAYLTLFAVLQGLPGHESAVSAALAAGVSGALVQPLGRRLARGVDRLYYGHRADPFAVTSRMSAALTGVGLDVDRVPDTVCRTVVSALRLPRAELRLDERVLASAGEGAAATDSFDLRHRGELVARLLVTPRPGEASLADSDRAVLQSLADQVAPALAALRLHHELQRSRELLVSAREAERLQLRRDLHDGLGASLAGLRLQLESAQDLVADPVAGGLLERAGATVTHAVGEVRSICEGLRPPGIDDLGLARGLQALVERSRTPALDVRLDVRPEEGFSLPAAVEVAVYRIAAEALANAVKHAGARHVQVSLVAGRDLELVVADDGTGLRADPATAGGGVGLDSMRRRAEEIGGRLVLDSDEHGTRVSARLPLTLPDPASGGSR